MLAPSKGAVHVVSGPPSPTLESMPPLGHQAIRDVTRRPRPVWEDLGAQKIQLVQVQLQRLQRQAPEPRDHPTTTRGLQRRGMQDGQARRRHRPQRARPARAHLPHPRAPLTARARGPAKPERDTDSGAGAVTTGDPPALHKVTAASCATAEEAAAAARGHRKCRLRAPPCPRPRGGHFRSWGVLELWGRQGGLPRPTPVCVEDAPNYPW